MKKSIIVVDNFYTNPNAVWDMAMRLEYKASSAHYKGLRADVDLPDVWGEIEHILGHKAYDRYMTFQKTTEQEPLVYHSDHQAWAGAVYLGPFTSVAHGTSFWRHAALGFRRPTGVSALDTTIYSDYNLTHPDNWELVDRIGSVYNRLVIWDAQLVHSATSYEGCTEHSPRLAQLFFFN